jgi:hypothetical protein
MGAAEPPEIAAKAQRNGQVAFGGLEDGPESFRSVPRYGGFLTQL